MSGLCLSLELQAATPKPRPLEPLIESWWLTLDDFIDRLTLDHDKERIEACAAMVGSSWRFTIETEVAVRGRQATVSRIFSDHAGTTTLSMNVWYHWTSLALGFHRAAIDRDLQKHGWRLREPIPTVRAVLAKHEAEGPDLILWNDELMGRTRGKNPVLFGDDKQERCPKGAQGEDVPRDPVTAFARALWPSSTEHALWVSELSEDEAEAWFQLAWALHRGDKKAVRAMSALDEKARPYLWFLLRHGTPRMQRELCSLLGKREGKRAGWEAAWIVLGANMSKEGYDELAAWPTEGVLNVTTCQSEEYLAALGEALERDDEVGLGARYALDAGFDPADGLPGLSKATHKALQQLPPRSAAILKTSLLHLLTDAWGDFEQRTIALLAKAPQPAREALVQALAGEDALVAFAKKAIKALVEPGGKTAAKRPAKKTTRSKRP